MMSTVSSLEAALDDCQGVMDACAVQLMADGWIDPAELQATADQLAEYAMKARDAIRAAKESI